MKKLLRYTIYFIAIFIFSIAFRVFVFDIFLVPSASMQPALEPGDVIWVNKLLIGPRLPANPYEIPWIGVAYWLTGGKKGNITGKIWNYRRFKGLSEIARNDIMVFNHPKFNEVLVKRCLGLPGDTLRITKIQVLLNNKEIPCDTLDFSWFKGSEQHKKDNSLIIIPENSNSYFFVGDNYLNSDDSRYWGFVPEEKIIGKAVLVLFNFHEGKFRRVRFMKRIK